MRNHFREIDQSKIENFEPQNRYADTPDNVMTKDVSPSGGTYLYEKYITIDEVRYFIEIIHQNMSEDGEFEIHFGLTDTETSPITNAGLEVFGKLADEMSKMYEEIRKENSIKQFKIHASPDNHKKEDTLESISNTISGHPEKLNGLTVELLGDGIKTTLEIKNNLAIIKTKKRLGLTSKSEIPVTKSLFDDIKHIAKVDPSFFLPDIFNYIKDPELKDVDKKQVQRLKLYLYYFKKRYPEFIFNSKTNIDGELEFEKDEYGEPYLLVTTNNHLLK